MNRPQLIIKFLGYELSPKEARTLYKELSKLFDEEKENQAPKDDPKFLYDPNEQEKKNG